jgi:F-type H+-transporting ATPase subunit epsilon
MAETLEFELVSPERLLISRPVEMVVVPGAEGDFGALPRHAPLISLVRPGVIDVYQDGVVTDRIFVAGGFAEVNETRCTVLAEEAIVLADLDPANIEQRLQDAQRALAEAESDHAKRQAERAILIGTAMQAAVAERAAKH